jgi:hypothetical protein
VTDWRGRRAIVFYISGHGFGHASRQIEVINALAARAPDLRLVVRTSAPRWLFGRTLRLPVEVQTIECDTGVVQIDSLRPDERATITRAREFHATFEERSAAEAAVLERLRAAFVVGDIPPLAFAAAARTAVPAVALANFTWDWIYEDYAEHLHEAPDLLPVIRAAYAQAAAGWRLPMSGGFATIREVIDLPFVARQSRRDPGEVRRALGLPTDRPLVLVSFGGYGLDGLDEVAVAGGAGFGVVTTNNVGRAAASRASEWLIRLDEQSLYGRGYRYEDLVRAVDIVVTKPGYGIIAECIANDTAMLYTSRGRFAEYQVLLSEMPRYLRCAFLEQSELRAGQWLPHLERLLAQTPPAEKPLTNGAAVAAEMILAAASHC